MLQNSTLNLVIVAQFPLNNHLAGKKTSGEDADINNPSIDSKEATLRNCINK